MAEVFALPGGGHLRVVSSAQEKRLGDVLAYAGAPISVIFMPFFTTRYLLMQQSFFHELFCILETALSSIDKLQVVPDLNRRDDYMQSSRTTKKLATIE